MQANIADQITSGTFSKAHDDGKISGHWSIFAGIFLLVLVLVLCAAGTAIGPGLQWPESTFVGP